MDSSGKYLAFKVCKGSETEPNILNSWDFYHQLKAAEAQIALPGVVVIPPPPFHPEHPRPPPGIGPRAVGRAGGRGPRAPRPEPDIPRLPAVQMLPPAAYLNRLRWRLNVTKVPPNCQTTAAGIIVDGRYTGSGMCSLLVAPSKTDFARFDQVLQRTRMFHDRQFGILTQYDHIKMRPMPAESSGHDFETAIHAMLCLMNLRLTAPGNLEHACRR